MKITFTSGYGYWGQFLPTDLRDPNSKAMIGGGETAMISMARELAARGHHVTVFHDVARPGTYEDVDYLPTKLYPDLVTALGCDVLVSWDSSLALRYADRAKVHVMAFQLNDAHIGVFDHAVDLYFHPSNWHAERFHQLYPEIDTKKQRARFTNAVDLMRYTQGVVREPHRVIYSSSPDRGLHHLLRMWPTIVEAVPDATLHVFYDTAKWLATTFDLEAKGYPMHTADRAHLIDAAQKAPTPSIVWHGGVGQWQLAREQLASGLMVYPCDPVQPTEGFSMSCLEGVAAGCTLITSTADALPELWASAPDAQLLPLPVDDGVWSEAIIRELLANNTKDFSVQHPLEYTWPALATFWETEFANVLRS